MRFEGTLLEAYVSFDSTLPFEFLPVVSNGVNRAAQKINRAILHN